MARPRKFQSIAQLESAWMNYKEECNNKVVTCHDFSAKNSEFVTAELKKSVTYTILGFSHYIGLTRSAFYDTYANDPKFSDIVTRMREECEEDAREKLELGIIPTQLAGLWMSEYGYSTKADDKLNADMNLNVLVDYGSEDSEQ